MLVVDDKLAARHRAAYRRGNDQRLANDGRIKTGHVQRDMSRDESSSERREWHTQATATG